MKRFLTVAFLVAVAITTACGGGGGSSTGGIIPPPPGPPPPNPGPTPITGSFTPAQASPGNLTVSMGAATVSADLVTIPVKVTGVNGVYAASFDVHFNSAYLEYAGGSNCQAGTLLEQGGQAVSYNCSSPTGSSLLVVSASRSGAVPGVNVTTSLTLVRLTFHVKGRGSFPITFENAFLFDAAVQPQKIPNLVNPWPAGTLVGS